MKKKFDDLRANLEEFAEQTDYSVLLLGCTPDEAPYAAQFLDGVDQARPEDYVLAFTEPFISERRYLDALMWRLREDLREANEARSGRGEAPFPDPPAELDEAARPCADRLERLLRFLATLLPNAREHAFVVAFLPFENADNEAFCRLMASLLPEHADGARPDWMAALRIIVSDDRRQRRLAERLREASVRSVLHYEVDLSTPALTDALSRDAADPSLPIAQRMAGLLQLAALDFSYRRFDAAIAKYAVLYDYYRDPPLPVMQVLCLQGLGDCLRAAGKLDLAQRALQSGIALALAHGALIPLLNALLSAVGVCTELGQHEEAESYSESGRQCAQAAMNVPLYVSFVEKKGDAQRASGRAALAVETYHYCVELAEKYELFSVWKSVLEKLAALYGQARMHGELEGVRRELVRVDALEHQRQAGESPAPCEHAACTPALGAVA